MPGLIEPQLQQLMLPAHALGQQARATMGQRSGVGRPPEQLPAQVIEHAERQLIQGLDKGLPGLRIEASRRITQQRIKIEDGLRRLRLALLRRFKFLLLVTHQPQGTLIGLAQCLEPFGIGLRVMLRQTGTIGIANQRFIGGRVDTQLYPATHDQSNSSSDAGRCGKSRSRCQDKSARQSAMFCASPWAIIRLLGFSPCRSSS
jgi:hypothetical protein